MKHLEDLIEMIKMDFKDIIKVIEMKINNEYVMIAYLVIVLIGIGGMIFYE